MIILNLFVAEINTKTTTITDNAKADLSDSSTVFSASALTNDSIPGHSDGGRE